MHGGQEHGEFDTAYQCGQPDNISSLAAGGKATANQLYEVPSGFALTATWLPDSLDKSVVFQTPLL
jgi:hypothetical protein